MHVWPTDMKIAVLLPCYNEEGAIGTVIQSFRNSLPQARIYVFDNNSSDNTAKEARKAGATVRFVKHQGKGYVVRRMFADVDADIYIMADGDDTYDAAAVPEMVERLFHDNLDMVVGIRKDDDVEAAYRPGHRFGNWMFNRVVSTLFGDSFTDIMSGYRIMSNRLVKSFPAMSSGFETETELSIHALQMALPVAEMETAYKERAEGTESKLKTYQDGAWILWHIILLYKDIRPFSFFGIFAALFAMLSLGLGYPVFIDYLDTGLVDRLPTAVLAASIMIMSFIGLTCGLILDSTGRRRLEAKRLTYLTFPSLRSIFAHRKSN